MCFAQASVDIHDIGVTKAVYIDTQKARYACIDNRHGSGGQFSLEEAAVHTDTRTLRRRDAGTLIFGCRVTMTMGWGERHVVVRWKAK